MSDSFNRRCLSDRRTQFAGVCQTEGHSLQVFVRQKDTVFRCLSDRRTQFSGVYQTEQRSTLTIVRESKTPKYCVGLPNNTARQSVGLLNF